jgi:hypothetical protein
VVEHERGTDWIVPRCVELKDEHGRRVRFVVDKRGPAATLIDDLKAERLRVVEARRRGLRPRVRHVLRRRRERVAALPGAAARARRGARRRAQGAARRRVEVVAEELDEPDISPLVAVTLARWGASAKPAEAARHRPERRAAARPDLKGAACSPPLEMLGFAALCWPPAAWLRVGLWAGRCSSRAAAAVANFELGRPGRAKCAGSDHPVGAADERGSTSTGSRPTHPLTNGAVDRRAG